MAGGVAPDPAAPKIRVGMLDMPLDTLETLTLTPADFETYKQQMLSVEQQRCGAAAYPADPAARRPAAAGAVPARDARDHDG